MREEHVRPVLLLAVLLLGGCLSSEAPRAAAATCTADVATSPGAQGMCVVTADGWILQGALWNGTNATRTVVLVHGLNEGHNSYDGLAQRLSAKGYRVIAFDSRGHAGSTHRVDGSQKTLHDFGPYDFLAMEQDIEAVGRAYPPDALVGASVGANEALQYAAAHGSNVTSLVLLSAGDAYRGIDATIPVTQYAGPILFLAAQDDTYAAQSAPRLAQRHPGLHEVDVVQGALHGTNLLQDPGIVGSVETWIARATKTP